jgi:hypothetical protein
LLSKHRNAAFCKYALHAQAQEAGAAQSKPMGVHLQLRRAFDALPQSKSCALAKIMQKPMRKPIFGETCQDHSGQILAKAFYV